MRASFRTAACSMVAFLLTACGGGSPTTTSIHESCKISLLYANGSANGSGTPISTNLTESAPRKFNLCPLQTINSASVNLCLDHPQISELTAQLRLPDNSTLPLTLPTTASGPACLTNGTLFNVHLPATGLPHPNSGNGNWTVGVIETNKQFASNSRGILVGWSMDVEGLK
jgi:subtilisin-like proprotein convertase family protein